MKTKIYLTMFVIPMSVQIAVAQQIIYGDQNKNTALLTNNIENDEITRLANITYYKVDETVPNTFTPANNNLIVCHLIPGSDTNIVCSTSMPEKGWGTMVTQDNGKYSYEEKLYNDGTNIYSIAFTDPKNGWAVGVMEKYSIHSGVVFHTEDGGKSWNLQFLSGTEMKLNSVGFSDPKNGWTNGVRTVGNATFETMLVTNDGGDTWKVQNLVQLNGDLNSSDLSLMVSK